MLFKRRPDGPAGKDHIIHKDHDLVLDIEGDVRGLRHGLGLARCQIVPVHRDVQAPDRRLHPSISLDFCGKPFGKMHAAPLDADEDEILRAFVLFQDLMGDPRERPVDAGLIKDQGFFLELISEAPPPAVLGERGHLRGNRLKRHKKTFSRKWEEGWRVYTVA